MYDNIKITRAFYAIFDGECWEQTSHVASFPSVQLTHTHTTFHVLDARRRSAMDSTEETHLERSVRDQLNAVGQGHGTAGGALPAGVDDGLDGAIDLGQ